MKRIVLVAIIAMQAVVASSQSREVIKVASFKGIQVTGVTVSNKGRIFANFPRWRMGVPFSVVEVMNDGSYRPYPNLGLNRWEVGQPADSSFIGVQSVVANGDMLYILDTANPLFKGIITQPRLFVYDLKSDNLVKTYKFPSSAVHTTSYVNDLRIDNKRNLIYFTDSGEPGIIILDTKKGLFTRVLDNHPFTKAEVDFLTFNGARMPFSVHSDGIELDARNDILYFHALSGYTLYGIEISTLLDPRKLEKAKPFMMKTAAPDGMIMDENGNLYYGDLENNKIEYITPDRKQIRTLLEGEAVKWADTFSIHSGYLYYTNSRINEAKGDISSMEFTINKVKLP